MTKKVLQNRGGLFNRASRTIYLEPFTLHECEELVEEQQSVIDRKDIAAAYMIFGGAPYSAGAAGESVAEYRPPVLLEERGACEGVPAPVSFGLREPRTVHCRRDGAGDAEDRNDARRTCRKHSGNE